MKHFFTKIALALSAIILFSGIILIRAMTTTDTQTIIEDISTAQDQMMDIDRATQSAEDAMVDTTVMQEIAEPGLEEPEMIEDLSMTTESQIGDEDDIASDEQMSMESITETMDDDINDESEPTQDADDIMIEEEIDTE